MGEDMAQSAQGDSGRYQDDNSAIIDRWVAEGWEWGKPIDHEQFVAARHGDWQILLTPTKPVPRDWFPADLKGMRVLGLASGGGQQMPILTAAGARCTVLDYSEAQLEGERVVARREGYGIECVRADRREKRRSRRGRHPHFYSGCLSRRKTSGFFGDKS